MGENIRLTPFLRQVWTVSGVLFSVLGQGLMMGYPACLLPALQAPDSPIKADLASASWFASIAGIANLIGTSTASILIDIFGRRRPYFLYIIPEIMGWALIYFAKDMPTLMVGRTLGTITGGALASMGPIAIGEYTSPEHRGMFLTLKTVALYLGITIVHILGNHFHWKTIAIFGMAPQIIAFIIVLTWRESPSWLAMKGRFEISEKTFYWLRGDNDVTNKELQDLFRAQKNNVYDAQISSNCSTKFVEILKKFTRKNFVKPLFIMFLCGFVIEFSGRHVFPTYAIQIVEEITSDKTNTHYYTLGIDLIITASVTMSSILVRLLKRRTLLLTTGLSAALVLLFACIYLFLESRNVISTNTTVPIAMFTIYFILANLGCTTIPLGLLGELFPLSSRGLGVALSGIILSIFLTLNLKMTPYLLASVQVYGTFALFAIILGVMLIVLFFILPETKDRTLTEIEDYFNHGRFKDEGEVKDDDEAKIKMVK